VDSVKKTGCGGSISPNILNLSTITLRHLARVVEALNQRPGTCLADRAPAEVFARAAGVYINLEFTGLLHAIFGSPFSVWPLFFNWCN
jgi:hypothetical protein